MAGAESRRRKSKVDAESPSRAAKAPVSQDHGVSIYREAFRNGDIGIGRGGGATVGVPLSLGCNGH